MGKITAFLITALLIINIFAVFAFATEQENLVLGLSYTVESGEPISDSYGGVSPEGVEFDKNNGELTDSVFGGTDKNSPAWFVAYSGQSRAICFDLGANCGVSAVSADFLHILAENVYLPRYINVYLSNNGTDYQLVNQTAYAEELLSAEAQVFKAEIKLRRTYSARYVKVEYATDYYVYCSELSVLGNKALTGSERELDPKPVEINKGYPTDINGSADIVRLYNGHCHSDHTIGVLTESEVLPYVAYINSYGEIAGKMFDTVLLSPCNGEDAFLHGWTMEDWELYITHTFTAGQDLDALNKVAGRVYSALGQDDKLKIYLTIPYPKATEQPFGDIDDDGKDEYSAELAERLDIVKWYINKCISEFESIDFSHLELAGFCWQSGSVDFASPNSEYDLICGATKYISRKKLTSIYSSEYLAPGFDLWEDMGFDSAFMQSGYGRYGIDGSFKSQMLSQFAKSLYYNRLGAEIGFADGVNDFDEGMDYALLCKNFESQLYYGSMKGYMNGVNMYGQGMGPGFFYSCCYADTATEKGVCLRRIYDATYKYINGNYNNMPPEIEVQTEFTVEDTALEIPVSVSDSTSYWGDIALEFDVLPQNGKAEINQEKTVITYTPNAGFYGTDSFSLFVSDGFGKSESVSVQVNVPEKNAPPATEDVVIPSIPTPSPQEEKMPIWLIPMVAVLGGIMVVVAIVTIFSKKKK